MSDKTYPKLLKQKKNGSVYTWEIMVVTDELNNAWIRTTYGTEDGKKTTNDEMISESANVGKANETSPFERACTKADTKFEGQKKKGYSETVESNIDPSPMLAVTYEHAKNMGKINFDTEKYLIQRKFDGTRMIIHIDGKDNVIAISRNKKKTYNISDLMISEIKKIYTLIPQELKYVLHLDGEAYHHGWPLQKINSIMSKDEQKSDTDIKYMLFDCFDPNKPTWTFVDRFTMLYTILHNTALKSIELVETFYVDTEDIMYAERDRFISEGYEGGILRKANGIYHGLDNTAPRTYDVMKLKKWYDLDLLVVGIHMGPKNKAATVVLDVKLPNGKTFGATGTGTAKYREEILATKKEHIGKRVKIKYTTFTDDGIPKNATAIISNGAYVWSD
jgi:ATP-dependent DNA ligase